MTLESDRPLTDGTWDLNQGFASMAWTSAAPCDGWVSLCHGFSQQLTSLPALVFTMSVIQPTHPTIFTGIGNPVVLGQLTTTDPLTIGVNPPEWGTDFAAQIVGPGGFNGGTEPLTFVVLGPEPVCSVPDGQPGSEDFDGDGICDADDSCPTVTNFADDDGDGIDNACDTCPTIPNAVFTGSMTNRTIVSGQLDDDADGVGNACDFDYDQQGFLVGPLDFAQAVAFRGGDPAFPSVAFSICGSAGDLPCGLFDHDGLGILPGPLDFALDVAKQNEPFPLNGPNCGAACTPPLSGPIGSGSEILGKAICVGPAC